MDNNFISVISKVLNIPKELLNEESNSSNTASWDSFAHWEIIASIEKAYNVEFTMDEAVEFRNLGEMHNALKEKGII